MNKIFSSKRKSYDYYYYYLIVEKGTNQKEKFFLLKMEIKLSDNYKNRTRNNRLNKISIIFLLYLCTQQVDANELPNVNDFQLSYKFKQNNTILRLTGIDPYRSNNIHFKGTFSSNLCNKNDVDLDYVQRINYFGYGNSSTIIDISLKQFNFGENLMAYVCAKFNDDDSDDNFVHLGINSKFSR